MSLDYSDLKAVCREQISLRTLAMLLGMALLCHGCGSPGPVRSDDARVADPVEGEALELLISPPAQAAYDEALEAMNGTDAVEAELQLEQFVLEYPNFPGAYVNLAILYERSDRHDEARAVLDQALAIDPAHSTANNQLGIVLRKQGRFAESEQAYLRAIETDPSYALAHHNLGVLLDLYLHRPAEALQHYQRYQELLAEPDAVVGRWIIDLQRRVGGNEDAAQLAQGDGI
jgi:tetratricopeptide (TPR) repeat protein